MKWFPFFILAYLVAGIQFGLTGYATVFQARPNLLLILVIFVAVNAPRNSALMGCFLLGLLQDLLAHQSPIGLAAFSYGLIGMLVVSVQEIVDRDHFLTHIFLALIAGLTYALLVTLHGWTYYALHSSLKLPRPSAAPLYSGALYTALLAPLALMLLRRFKRVFGFRPMRLHGSRR